MNKKQLLASLEDQDSSTLIKFLEAAYDQMDTDQRRAVFGKAVKKAKPPVVDAKSLLGDVKQFQRDSLTGGFARSRDASTFHQGLSKDGKPAGQKRGHCSQCGGRSTEYGVLSTE